MQKRLAECLLQPTFTRMKDTDECLNHKILSELNKLLEGKDMTRISQSLQRLFFDYLRHQKEGLPIDFDRILDDYETVLEMFYTLLKIMKA